MGKKVLASAGALLLLAIPAVAAERNIADEIADSTNAARESAGLPALEIDQTLSEVALRHAQNMARQHKMAHVLNGKDVADRLANAGYRFAWCGENVAYGYPGSEEVVAGWLKSKGHRENILNRHFTEIGVAVAYAKDGSPFYCQVFGRPR